MLASPALFGAAAALALVAVAVAVVRRVALPRATMILMTLALACVCLAAGGLTWQRRAGGHVAVVVDVSPSMRSAAYQDRAKLAARVDQLLGRTPYTLYELADGVRRAPSQAPSQLTRRVDSHQTTYAPPPDADAVVLFSDARFSTTNPTTERTIAATPAATPAAAAPQTFVVLDPALDNPPDVAIERLGIRGDTIVVTLFNGGGGRPRKMTISGTDVRDVPVDIPGRFVVTGKITPGAREAIAYVGPFDSWMGNDSLEIRVPPPATAEKWWVGAGPARAPAADWVRVDPGALPVNVLDYLAAGVIVLDNVPAD